MKSQSKSCLLWKRKRKEDRTGASYPSILVWKKQLSRCKLSSQCVRSGWPYLCPSAVAGRRGQGCLSLLMKLDQWWSLRLVKWRRQHKAYHTENFKQYNSFLWELLMSVDSCGGKYNQHTTTRVEGIFFCHELVFYYLWYPECTRHYKQGTLKCLQYRFWAGKSFVAEKKTADEVGTNSDHSWTDKEKLYQ